jgi:hypothetical protein
MPYSGFDGAWEMHRVLFACDESARSGRIVAPDVFLPVTGADDTDSQADVR